MSNKRKDSAKSTFNVVGASGNATVSGKLTAVGVKGPVPPGANFDVTGVTEWAKALSVVETVGVEGTSKSKSHHEKDSVDKVPVFGDGATNVLIVSGTGRGRNVFKAMAEKMKTKFEKMGVPSHQIWTVEPIPERRKTTWSRIKETFNEIRQEGENTNFIFYYCGHFSQGQTFLIDKEGKDNFRLPARELVKQLNAVCCTYTLTVLDMCFSAGFGAMGDEQSEGEMDDDNLHFKPDDVPDLWSLMGKEKSMAEDGGSIMADIQKCVQWSSSKAWEKSKYGPEGTNFTKAILDVMDGLPDTHQTVWDLNGRVIKKIRSRQQLQTPQVKPPTNEGYDDFPEFNC